VSQRTPARMLAISCSNPKAFEAVENYTWQPGDDQMDAYFRPVEIKARILRDRLPAAVLIALYREHVVYGEALEPVGRIITDDGTNDIASVIEKVFDGLKTAKSDTEEIVQQITPAQLKGEAPWAGCSVVR